MPAPTRPLTTALGGLLCVVMLTGCFNSPAPQPAEPPTPLVDGDWVGHHQALTAAGATPMTRVGDLVDDPAGCLTLVGSDHSRQPPTGTIWTATSDCTTLSSQWQASSESESGTELTDITVLSTNELLAVGHSLDNDNSALTGLVAIRDMDGRWTTTAQLGNVTDGPVNALGVDRSLSGLIIAGGIDGKAAVWYSTGGHETFEPVDLPVSGDFAASQASRIAVDEDTVVVTGRGTDDDGESTTLMWRSEDGGRTFDEVDLPRDVSTSLRISSIVVTASGEFFAVGQERADPVGLAMTSADGIDWRPVPPPDSGSLDVAIPTPDNKVIVAARPLSTDTSCGVTGLVWSDDEWAGFDLPCSEPGEAAGTMLSDGTIALILGNELWLRDA